MTHAELDPLRDPLRLLVITTGTSDYGARFVVREHRIYSDRLDRSLVAAWPTAVVNDLESARAAATGAGAGCNLGREPTDDPVIVETWLVAGPADLDPETIETAAIRVAGEVWALPRPARHHVLIHAWCDAHYKDGERGRIGKHEQGFVTSRGRFVERTEAASLALAAGQLATAKLTLFSEDLW